MTLDSTATLQKTIRSHQVYKSAVKEHAKFNLATLIEERLRPNLTGYTLAGEGKIAFRDDSLFFIDDKFLLSYQDFEKVDEAESNYMITFFHLGDQLSGHDGIVHGGLLATLLDELTCRVAFQNFHSKKGVTANLNINYRRPCYVNSVVMIRCEVLKKAGRKCWVKGLVYRVKDQGEDENELELLTDCECLVIEPKWVKDL